MVKWVQSGSPKAETRNPKEIRNPNVESWFTGGPSFGFRASDFFRISGFGLRI